MLNRFIKRTASAINTAVYGQPNGNTAYNTNNSVSTFNKVNHSNNPSLQLNENNLLDRDRLQAKFRQAELANNTPNTLADTSSGNKDYPIHSPFEDTPKASTNFVTSIYDYLVNWMKFHDASRCPSNTDVSQLDCVSSDRISMYSFFTTFNLIVYILFTVTLFFVLSNFTLFFISYFSKNITSWLGKVSKLFTGQSETDLKTVEFNKSLVSGIISINKVVIVCLFVILLILSMFLYNYYTISSYFSSHFSEILKAKYNTSIEVPIDITILTLPVHYFKKAAQLVLGIAFGFYRTYLLVRTRLTLKNLF